MLVAQTALRRRDGLGSARLELEEFTQRLGVVVAVGRRRELFDPDSGGMQQFVDDASNSFGDLVALSALEVGQAGLEPENLRLCLLYTSPSPRDS